MIEKQIIADTHVHSLHSHDSRATLEEICDAAVEQGISVIAITDHCDISFCRDAGNFDNIKRSNEAARIMNERMGDRLRVIAGVELGDSEWTPSLAAEFMKSIDSEVVIGSIHAVAYENYGMAFSCLRFDGWSQDDLMGFMKRYFDDMYEMIHTVDIDILAHMTVPLRYINGKYGNGFSIEPLYGKIERILTAVIERGIALEVNTSAYAALGATMPDRDVLQMYKSLGGKLVTLASDAHVPVSLGSNFKRAAELLKSCGFDSYVYIENKNIVHIPL